MSLNRLEMLAEIASLYYVRNLSQAEIAKRTGYSRSMISRLVSEAREQGLVEIKIHYPIARREDLEAQLVSKLSLLEARVVVHGGQSYPQLLGRLGTMGARVLEGYIVDSMTVGVSWGMAVHETVAALRPGICSGVHVMQLDGATGTPDPQIDGPELARRMAQVLNGRHTTLPAPLFVDSEMSRQAFLNESQIKRIMAQYCEIRLALVGVGTVLDPQQASFLRAGYLSHSQLKELEQAGAVGDVCGILFGANGELVDAPLVRREIGIDVDTLRAVPTRVAVAGGPSKVLPIVGASRARLINVLVTDELTASTILHDSSTGDFQDASPGHA
jgi:DNA-binding transcriptional regulator LsrR (DeoR family)